MENDTIVAISTGMQPSGIAVIRISGSKSIQIADSIFSGAKPLKEAFSHTVNFGVIRENGQKLDEVLAIVMKAPRTYTGEDTVEINCHGSLLIQKKIVELLVNAGARPAGPGEFTQRAFLNGKLDLAQAESVMDLISSESEAGLRNSMNQLSGNFSALINEMRQNLLYEIAFIESALDDPEHISLDGYPEKLKEIIEKLIKKCKNLISSYHIKEVLKDGIDCAIIGSTNVGKSSLLNALCGKDAAIVSSIPGTTRDSIERRIHIGDIVLNINDTAGLRNTQDEIENLGIARSKKFMEESELIFYVVDSSIPLSDEDRDYIGLINDKNTIILLNKSDLKPAVNRENILEITDNPVVNVSAKTLQGIDELEDFVKDYFAKYSLGNNKDIIAVNERHLNHLMEADNSLGLVIEAIENGMTEDIFAVDMTDAYVSLGKILGQEVGEDVIEEIFSKFCIGK